MAGNFDFLKNIDKELYLLIIDAEKLFRDEYFNQCAIGLRIFAEKLAKKIFSSSNQNMTFDDILNCLKDKAKTELEREFIEDLFFIKKQGNLCAHGEDIAPSSALETIERAFEASVNYAIMKGDKKASTLNFDKTLLITQKPQKELKLVDKYIELAKQKTDELLNLAQEENKYKEDKKEDPEKSQKEKIKERVKAKVKKAKKNIKNNINKPLKKLSKKVIKDKKVKRKKLYKLIFFLIFVTISLYFLTKMIFLF